MRVIGRVFFGEMPEEFVGHIAKIKLQDTIALVVLASILIIVGVYPRIMAPLVESGARTVLSLLGGA
jgi:NADH:ubiquinone oxidoreductase subunit 4 (subunit M)